MKRDLNCFDPNSISFYRLYSKYKAFVGVLSSSIWVLYQGRIFLAATERKSITDLFCLERAHFKVFFIFLSWRMQTVQRTWKNLETELTNITRRHFCSLPFLYWTFFYLLYYFLLSEFFFRYFVCFDILWQLPTTHARDHTRDKDANSSRQNDVTWCDFLQGKHISLSLSHSRLPQKTLKIYRSGFAFVKRIWARLVGKSGVHTAPKYGTKAIR